MKTIKKTIALTLGLIVMGGAASFAQSLADAKKAIDAEQYQKATGMLKTLTVSQAKEGDVYFNLGNVYLALEEVDSAKAIFSKGTIADPKNALNYVGLGHADLFKKDAALIYNTLKVMDHLDRALKDYCEMSYRGMNTSGQDLPKYIEENVLATNPVPDVDLLRYLEIYVKKDIPQDWNTFAKRVHNANAKVLLGIADKYGYPSHKRIEKFIGINLDIFAINFAMPSNNYHEDVSEMMKREYKLGNVTQTEFELYSIMGGKTYVTKSDAKKLEKLKIKQQSRRVDLKP